MFLFCTFEVQFEVCTRIPAAWKYAISSRKTGANEDEAATCSCGVRLTNENLWRDDRRRRSEQTTSNTVRSSLQGWYPESRSGAASWHCKSPVILECPARSCLLVSLRLSVAFLCFKLMNRIIWWGHSAVCSMQIKFCWFRNCRHAF